MKHPIDPKDLPLIEARFCRFFDKRGPDDCWPWIRGISGKYGRFYFRGHPYGSHVIAFLLANKRVKGNTIGCCTTAITRCAAIRHTCTKEARGETPKIVNTATVVATGPATIWGATPLSW